MTDRDLLRRLCTSDTIETWVRENEAGLGIVNHDVLPSRRHYTYILIRGQQPFYVGLGFGPRWRAHWLLTAADTNRHKKHIIMQLVEAGVSKEDSVIFVRKNLTRSQAGVLEAALIATIGREPFGPLTNLSDGGEAGTYGHKWTDGQRARFAPGRWVTDGTETRRVPLDMPMPDGWHEGRTFSEEHVEAARAGIAGLHTPEMRAKSQAAVNQWLAEKRPEVWITDGIFNRRLGATTPVPAGWSVAHTLSSEGRAINAAAATKLLADGEASRRGSLAWGNEDSRAALMASRADQCWITNGSETKRHSKAEPIPDGWRRGRGGLFGRAAAKAKQKEPEDHEHGRLL